MVAYPEGGFNDFVHQLPVRHSWSRIVSKRGLVWFPLWNWYQAGLTQSLGARRDGTVILMTPQGIPSIAWNFRGGLAAKWTGPAFDAMRDAVAIESLEIAHQGLDQRLMSIPRSDPIMVTIQNLEVHVDITGGGEDATFVRLFNRYIKLWSEQEARQKHRARKAAKERSLGDRPAAGMGES